VVGAKSLAAGHIELSTRRSRAKLPTPVDEAVAKAVDLLAR
jgi:hypothetical protein